MYLLIHFQEPISLAHAVTETYNVGEAIPTLNHLGVMGSTILGTNNNVSSNNSTNNKDLTLSKSRVAGKQLNCEIFPLTRPSRATNHPGNRKGLGGRPINSKEPLGTYPDSNTWGNGNNPPGVGMDGWVGPTAAMGYTASGYSLKLPLYCYKGDLSSFLYRTPYHNFCPLTILFPLVCC